MESPFISKPSDAFWNGHWRKGLRFSATIPQRKVFGRRCHFSISRFISFTALIYQSSRIGLNRKLEIIPMICMDVLIGDCTTGVPT